MTTENLNCLSLPERNSKNKIRYFIRDAVKVLVAFLLLLLLLLSHFSPVRLCATPETAVKCHGQYTKAIKLLRERFRAHSSVMYGDLNTRKMIETKG